MVVEPVTERSRAEMAFIADWYSKEFKRDATTIRFLLVGGWAVWSYNQYKPSVDIDIIASHRVRSKLFHVLRSTRGYLEKRSHDRAIRRLYLPHEEDEIIMDWERPNDAPVFKGKQDALPWKLGFKYHTIKDMEGGYIPVPERGILLLFKLKAIWDRSWNLEQGIGDSSWSTSKIKKDRSDVLALLDPSKGGDEIRIELIGQEMQRLPFLFRVLEGVADDPDASRDYRCSREEAREWVDRLMGLLRS